MFLAWFLFGRKCCKVTCSIAGRTVFTDCESTKSESVFNMQVVFTDNIKIHSRRPVRLGQL